MAQSMRELLQHQHILLIQGKMGSFFSRFSTFLQSQNIIVSKINLNAGDAYFYQHTQRVYNYRDTLINFDSYVSHLIHDEKIDAVVCFGDCRPHHAIAGHVCRREGVDFFVFEEGYLRPDYITLEKDGINGNSQLDVSQIDYFSKANDKPLFTDNRFYRMCLATIQYYIIARAKQAEYPHYEHYRGMTAWQEAMTWIKAPFIKAKGYVPDKLLEKRLTSELSERYFLVSLQVYNDSQITHHSDYTDITEFIEEVMQSFANYADKGVHLVLKHHPLDRAHRQYGAFIREIAKNLSVADRVHYGCDMHLPSLIRHSLGMVTINSTTGLQSIYHRKPTKTMGRAIYNIARLTDQQSLDTFWLNPNPPDHEYYLKFREYLIEQTQLNGSFYGRSPWKDKYILQKNDIEMKIDIK